MPSYRVAVEITASRAGVPADAVLPAIAAGVAAVANVEASDVRVARGRADVVVRFTAPDDGTAASIAGEGARAAREVAVIGGVRVTRRDGSRWLPLT
ncbi:hypothetical protein F8O01_15510 [Pseudoclavibacter chungangensis]|uniref:Uncharacterized protein n=1 Tax=Pseudoclavibacter chungangensis TaxID=587635 RepID=A0A7J5BNB1_9MICO|nr:hypothetical protein [Pseudoclavibacter chungangensis]KAB1653270.1 hypothetical protein F8O01_15510 [Pseudoclavibacter chungangensis]NYJ66957.1 hypothetical protein [Pseudoclavibacter chungangensis]